MNDMSIKSQTLDITAPVQQEGTKAVLRSWLKADGDVVKKDEPVVELETDKVVVEVCAPCDGVLRCVMPVDTDAAPGSLLGRVESASATAAVASASAQAAQKPQDRVQASAGEFRLSPSVRRLLAENELDAASICARGTGRDGRLTRQDVLDVIAQQQASPVTPPNVPVKTEVEKPPVEIPNPVTPAPVIAQKPPAATGGPKVASLIPHSSMRRKIAEHMVHSVTVAPHVTSVFEVDFSAIIAHRKRNKELFASQGVNLTFTAYFIAACVEAMKASPYVNSRWHAEHLEVFQDVNIGVGAALGDKGLIVPVIHQAQELSLMGIASRLQVVTEAARSGKLKPADVQGGTFTISNHGVSGSLFASPIIINQPQSAILGIGALEKRVVVKEIDGVDTFQVRPMAYVSLTIDHRVLDGSQTNAWLSRFVEVIQSWTLKV
ncbi:2-oxoglutarate dehydrogenase E2 component (dihydrolipoamide succinyltransferase) [Pseudomonas sp. 2725]